MIYKSGRIVPLFSGMFCSFALCFECYSGINVIEFLIDVFNILERVNFAFKKNWTNCDCDFWDQMLAKYVGSLYFNQ